MRTRQGHRPRSASRGMALLLGLLVLIVISILTLAGMRGMGTQERMARNLLDRNLAFQAAETALRAAEGAIAESRGGITGPLRAGTVVAAPGSPAYWRTCWEGSDPSCPPAVTVGADDYQGWGLVAPPAYRIERLSASSFGSLSADEALASAPLFRITARAQGGTAQTVVILQSTFMP